MIFLNKQWSDILSLRMQSACIFVGGTFDLAKMTRQNLDLAWMQNLASVHKPRG